jgi:hypothetical protein
MTGYGARAVEGGHAQGAGDERGVDAVRAGGQDQHGGAAGVEDQRVRDRADLAAERGGRLRGGAGGVRQHADGSARAEVGETGRDVVDARVAQLRLVRLRLWWRRLSGLGGRHRASVRRHRLRFWRPGLEVLRRALAATSTGHGVGLVLVDGGGEISSAAQ